MVNLDRTRTLDRTLSRFYDGLNTLPAYARNLKDYYAHLTAPVRVLETGRDGQQVARYVESGPDHLAHAENYCTAAMHAPQPAAVTSASRAVNLTLLTPEARLRYDLPSPVSDAWNHRSIRDFVYADGVKICRIDQPAAKPYVFWIKIGNGPMPARLP